MMPQKLPVNLEQIMQMGNVIENHPLEVVAVYNMKNQVDNRTSKPEQKSLETEPSKNIETASTQILKAR